jgi:hypothetical protein
MVEVLFVYSANVTTIEPITWEQAIKLRSRLDHLIEAHTGSPAAAGRHVQEAT